MIFTHLKPCSAQRCKIYITWLQPSAHDCGGTPWHAMAEALSCVGIKEVGGGPGLAEKLCLNDLRPGEL